MQYTSCSYISNILKKFSIDAMSPNKEINLIISHKKMKENVIIG